MDARHNRGPSAAAENRAALLAAARSAFSAHGARVPMSTIARAAGVGQAVLYRHFPTREAIAMAVFDQNMAQVEELAARPDSRLRDVTDLITHQIEGIAAVIDRYAHGEPSDEQRELTRRLRHALAPVRERAIAAGELREDTEVEDLMLAVAMVAGVVTAAPPDDRHQRATAAWGVLMGGLAPR